MNPRLVSRLSWAHLPACSRIGCFDLSFLFKNCGLPSELLVPRSSPGIVIHRSSTGRLLRRIKGMCVERTSRSDGLVPRPSTRQMSVHSSLTLLDSRPPDLLRCIRRAGNYYYVVVSRPRLCSGTPSFRRTAPCVAVLRNEDLRSLKLPSVGRSLLFVRPKTFVRLTPGVVSRPQVLGRPKRTQGRGLGMGKSSFDGQNTQKGGQARHLPSNGAISFKLAFIKGFCPAYKAFACQRRIFIPFKGFGLSIKDLP